MTRVAISEPVLRWAVGRSGRPEAITRKFPKLNEWLTGSRHPTLRQVEQLARATGTPLGYLFLSEPPKERSLPPPLKWAGGKRWQVPRLKPLWRAHSHRRLVEPFCGGLAVALGLRPQRALLNDINPHLVNFYRWLRRGLRIDLPLENRASVFYAYRQRFNKLIASGRANSREAATLFYYLNRTGYRGLCRFNRRGEFNVPFGRHTRIAYVRDLTAYRAVLAPWDFTVGDFERIALEPDDFVYADPPYDVEFTQYAKEGFSWADQVRTAEWLSAHAGPVVLVNQATDRICRLYESLGFCLECVTAPRHIKRTGDRTPVREVMAFRNIQTDR